MLTLLSAFAPHLANELLEKVCHTMLEKCEWPVHDPQLIIDETMSIIVQVNGKLRGNITVDRTATKEVVIQAAHDTAEKWLSGSVIAQTVYVPGKLVNFVIR